MKRICVHFHGVTGVRRRKVGVQVLAEKKRE